MAPSSSLTTAKPAACRAAAISAACSAVRVSTVKSTSACLTESLENARWWSTSTMLPPRSAMMRGDAGQAARAVGHADAQAHQALGAHQAAQDHGRQQAAVDVAAAQDEADACRPRKRSG